MRRFMIGHYSEYTGRMTLALKEAENGLEALKSFWLAELNLEIKDLGIFFYDKDGKDLPLEAVKARFWSDSESIVEVKAV